MVGDLNRSGILVGKTRDEVTELLGPPDRESPGWRMEYELTSDGFYEWRSCLWIDFNETTGRVERVRFFD